MNIAPGCGDIVVAFLSVQSFDNQQGHKSQDMLSVECRASEITADMVTPRMCFCMNPFQQ